MINSNYTLIRSFERNVIFAALLSAFLMMGGCESSHQGNELKPVIQNVKTHFIPDSRVDHFEIETAGSSEDLVLKGETTLAPAKAALLDSVRAMDIQFTDSITVLPEASLETKIFGLINNSVGNIRSEGGHAEQLVTQGLLGMPVRVLKKDGGWYLIQTPDHYLGWIDSGGLARMDSLTYNKWKNAEKLIYTETVGFSYEEPSRSAKKVSDLVAGSILKLDGTSGDYFKGIYPDGRVAYVPKEETKPLSEWQENMSVTKSSLAETAETMIGAPYLWGGTSTKGMDCSGFTKTIYFMNGMIIPRDASQQVNAGVQIDTDKNFDKLEVGDLLFFGLQATEERSRRVVHVGMWIGDNQFIHSAGRVHVSSVDSAAVNYDPYNLGRYLESRRYLNNRDGNIASISEMYQNLN